MNKIKIKLNGDNFEVVEGSSISQLITSLDLDVKKIAIEHNLEIIPVEDFEKSLISEGDNIEMVHFIGGG